MTEALRVFVREELAALIRQPQWPGRARSLTKRQGGIHLPAFDFSGGMAIMEGNEYGE
jgi:hypothetical protein